MPYIRKKRRVKKVLRKKRFKKRYNRKGTSSTKTAAVSFSSGDWLFAPKMVAKLPYAQSVSLGVGTSDVANYYTFRCCSINDPNFTGTGHQPRGHDELALFYAHYRVIGAKITIDASLRTPAGASNTLVFVNRTAAAPASASEFTIENIMERQSVTRRVLTAEKPTAKLVSYYSPKKVFGAGKTADLVATFNTNPAEEQYWNFGYNNYAYGQAQSAVDFMVTVDYIVLATERKITSSS